MNPDIVVMMQNKYVLLGIGIWEVVWKGLALWKASKTGQKGFFISILIFNTIGLLPISYLIYRWVVEKKAIVKEIK